MKFEGNRREGVTVEDRNVQQFYTIQLQASCSKFKRNIMGKAADKKLVIKIGFEVQLAFKSIKK